MQAEIVEENIGVLSVNNKAVSENIHFNLAKPFTIKSEKEGTAKLELSVMGILPVKTVEAKSDTKYRSCCRRYSSRVSMDTRGIMVLGTGYVNGIEIKFMSLQKEYYNLEI